MDRVALLPLVARWWWVLAVGTIAAGVAGYVAVTKVPKTYEAEVRALVGPINTDVSLEASGSLAGTYAGLATSQTVLDAAIRDTGSKLTTTELAKSTSVVSNAVTRIVTITVESRSPNRAAQLANALATHLRSLSTDIDSTSKGTLEALLSQAEIKSLAPAIQGRVQRAASRVLGPSDAGRLTIIDPARPPEKAVKPVVPLVVLLSALSGLLIVGIFILFRESRRFERDEGRQADLALGVDLAAGPGSEPEHAIERENEMEPERERSRRSLR